MTTRLTQQRVNDIVRDAHRNIRTWDYMAGLVGRPDPVADALIQDEKNRIARVRAAYMAQQREMDEIEVKNVV